jgi:ATP-dependent Clp protease ATP-binding subunit ClpB
MDEASSRLRIEMDSLPQELDELNRRIMQLEIERRALKKENSTDAKEKLKKLVDELEELKIKSSQIQAHWEKEKALINRVRQLKEDIDNLKNQQQEAERRNDYELASQIQYGRIPGKTKEMGAVQQQLAELQKTKKILTEEITEEDIARVVSLWTGVPVEKLMSGERDNGPSVPLCSWDPRV